MQEKRRTLEYWTSHPGRPTSRFGQGKGCLGGLQYSLTGNMVQPKTKKVDPKFPP